MENAAQIVAELHRTLNDRREKTESEIRATEAAIQQIKRRPASVDEVAKLLTQRCQEVSAAGAARILQLKDHGDMEAVNGEHHFMGALTELVFFLCEEELTAITLKRLRQIWPSDGIGCEQRKTELQQLDGKLAGLRNAKIAIERELQSLPQRPLKSGAR